MRETAGGGWLEGEAPVAVITAATPGEVPAALMAAERRVQEEGLFAVGFVCYEGAAGFDGRYITHPPGELPPACFALFATLRRTAALPEPDAAPRLDWVMDTAKDDYVSNIAHIKREIAAGNTYQINYTIRQHARGVEDSWQLFLATASDAPYAAYLEWSGGSIVSASPELFFELDGERITCRPMKGTAPRGLTAKDDRGMRERLVASAKDRAENVMIVDMVRNDLGRIARSGTVRAAPLFDIEKYRTVWQLTSTVTAETDRSVAEIFAALFPSASITGAPKMSSMGIIAALEHSPRGVYTGAVGFMAPDRKARFSVAIRTTTVDGAGRATYGAGGGIVWDSAAEDEYQECLNKTRILAWPAPKREFRLLETMLWTPVNDFLLLEEHLGRLAESAEYFDFAFEGEMLRRRLEEAARNLPAAPHRVRLLLARDGTAAVQAEPLDTAADEEGWRLALAASPVDPADPFLYHKTTERSVYERARAEAPGYDDVLLWNPEGYVTETTTANLLVLIEGRLHTPPVDCGLLNGTLRQRLVKSGAVVETRMRVPDLARAGALLVANSVRGILDARLDEGALRRFDQP